MPCSRQSQLTTAPPAHVTRTPTRSSLKRAITRPTLNGTAAAAAVAVVPAGPLEAGSPVVVDDLDVVPVGVQDESAVVARVVVGALAGSAVVLVARGERRGV